MDGPRTSTDQSSLEDFTEGYRFSQDLNSTSLDVNDYIDFNHNTASETPVGADESIVDSSGDQNGQYKNNFSPDGSWGVFDELESGPADGLCKRTILDGKCDCPVCSSICSQKPFNKDLRELVNSDIPEVIPVLTFHMPPDGSSGQLDSNSGNRFSSDISLLQPPPGSSQNRYRPINSELCRKESKKRKRTREKSSDTDAIRLLDEVLQSGGSVSPELLGRIRQSLSTTERSPNPNATMLSSGRQDTNFESSRFTSGPFTGMGPSMNANIPSDFNFVAPMQSQTAISRALVPSSRSHDSTMSNTALVGPHMTQYSSSTLYPCTFKSCDRIFLSKSDWKRHEESVHKQRYMCMECCAGHAYPQGGYACGVCFDAPFASLGAVKMHTIQCEEAQEVGKSFTRKDKLRTHLREEHGQLVVSEDALGWHYDVDGDWPRECGFCGDPLYDWDLRADHIERHFVGGERISTWKIPFPRPRDAKHQGLSNYPDDDDEEDDDNDFDHGFDDSKGSGGIGDFSQSYSGAKSTYKQCAYSTMMRNYRTHGQDPTQEVDELESNVWDFESEDNESESTYNQTIVCVPANSSKLLEMPLCLRTSTDVVDHHIFSLLSGYLSDKQQHERLLLGLGRRPLNVIIGAEKHLEDSVALLTPEENTSKISQPLPTYTSSRANSACYSGRYSKVSDEPKRCRYRTPDDDRKYISSTSRGAVEVISHRKAVYDPAEPRASEATCSDYKEMRRYLPHRYRR